MNAAHRLDLLDAVRILHTAGGALSEQARLHGQLAQVEWEEEKNRLLQMLIVILLGFACLLCVMLFAGGLLLAATWDTPYWIAAAGGLLLALEFGMAAAWRRF